MTIKSRLMLNFLVITILPVLIIGFLSGHHAEQALKAAQIANLEVVADLKAEKIEAFYAKKQDDIEIARDFTSIKRALPVLAELLENPKPIKYIAAKKILDSQLQSFQRVNKYLDVMLVNKKGTIIYVSNEKHAGEDLDQPLPDPGNKAFVNGKKGIYFTDIFPNPVEEDVPYSMLVTAPVYDSLKRFIGVIALEVDMNSLYSMIQDTKGLGETGETLIGKIEEEEVFYLNPLRHDKEAALNKKVKFGSESALTMQEAVLLKSGSGLSIDYRGKDVIAAWRYIPSFNWGMVVKIDKKEAFAAVIKMEKQIFIFGIIILMIVTYIAITTAKSIANPILSLQLGMEIVGSGNLDHRVGTDARDEIGQLSRIFDQMTENIGTISASRNALTQDIQQSMKSLQKEVAERQEAEKKALKSEVRMQSILETATGAIITIGERGIVESFNHAAERIFGYASEEAIGRNISFLMPSPHKEKHDGYLSRYMETGEAHIIGIGRETVGRRKGGEVFPIYLSVSKIDLDDSIIFTGIVRDITKQKRAEENQRIAATVFNATTEAITVTNANGNIVSVNPAFSQITGYSAEEVIGKNPQILQSGKHDKAFYKTMWDTINTTGHWHGEIWNRRKDGEIYAEWLSINTVKNRKGKVIQYIGLFIDISEKKRAEEDLIGLNHDLQSANDKLHLEISERERIETELRMAQKLEAVGQLAAGIAHEINTPMQYLGDNVHFLKTAFDDYLEIIGKYQEVCGVLTQVPGHETLLEELKEAEETADLSYLADHLPQSFERTFEGIERVSTIVKAMKDFSHPDQREKTSIDLNQGLTSTLTVARNEYKYVADVETELGNLPPVLCHAGEINQVFLNLIVNAAHAIGDVVKDTQSKGKIHIRTEVEKEDTVLITIRDSGAGIPENIRQRVFDPFFTTKAVGRGTGQGLAMARSTVADKHGGSLTLKSEVGEGTTFFIRLPIHGNNGTNGENGT